jgi:hypothetical protein
MDFLLDNSQFARVKWLGRKPSPSGKSVYLNNLISERVQPSRPSKTTDGIVKASLRLESATPTEANEDRRRGVQSSSIRLAGPVPF